MMFNINVNNQLVEFEGNMIPEFLLREVIAFRKEHEGHLVTKPNVPTNDSDGREINSDGHLSYVKLMRNGDKIPTIMTSKDNSAKEAFIYSATESRWKRNPAMWQEYVYKGSLGLDFVYIDDKEVKRILKLYKKLFGR